MGIRSTVKSVLAVAVGTVGGVALLAAPAAAYASPPAGVYSGNVCQDANWYIDNAGAEACAFRNGFTPNSSLSLAAGAYDYARDGYSVKTDMVVQQASPYVGWHNTASWSSVINSSGYGTTKVGGRGIAYKEANMTAVRVWLRACTYDAPTGRHISCGSRYIGAFSWSTGS